MLDICVPDRSGFGEALQPSIPPPPEGEKVPMEEGCRQQVQQVQFFLSSPHPLTPAVLVCPLPQQFPPQLQLHKPLESSPPSNAEERGGGTNGAPESRLWLRGRLKQKPSGEGLPSNGDAILGVSVQPPPLIDEGEADRLSCCLVLDKFVAKFLYFSCEKINRERYQLLNTGIIS